MLYRCWIAYKYKPLLILLNNIFLNNVIFILVSKCIIFINVLLFILLNIQFFLFYKTYFKINMKQ